MLPASSRVQREKKGIESKPTLLDRLRVSTFRTFECASLEVESILHFEVKSKCGKLSKLCCIPNPEINVSNLRVNVESLLSTYDRIISRRLLVLA